jgi:predicted PurR-regulated permease PerM
MDEPVRPDPPRPADAPAAEGPPSLETPVGGRPESDSEPGEADAITDPEDAVAAVRSRRRLGRRVGAPTPRALLIVAAAVVLVAVLYLGRSALAPFVIGLVLAYLLDLPVERMARRGVPRWLSVLIVYAVVVVVVVQALLLTLRPLASELATFIEEFPSFTAQVADMYAHLDLPPALRQAIDTWLADLGTGVGGLDPGDLVPVVTGIAGVVGSIVSYIIIPVWVFYLIKDRPALVGAAERSVPKEWQSDGRAVGGIVLRVFGQWLRGQLFLGVTVGAATFLGLLILSATVNPVFGRFAVLLSVVAGVLELLPIIGPIIAAIPAVLLALTAGIDAAVAALVLYTLVQQVENNVLVPKIQGDAVELHPSAVMIALVVGGAIAGLLGAILALPITAAARTVFRYLFHRLDDPPMTPDEALAVVTRRPILVVDGATTDATEAGARA